MFAGSDVNHSDESGRTALIAAATSGANLEVLEYLLTREANIDHQGINGWSVLHIAAFYNHTSFVR